MDLMFTLAGLALLVGAGDALVRGAVALSLKLGVSVLVISLTVVAFGTSAPELFVGVQAALDDADGIVMGNVVGSNIANVLLVLGVPAMISGIETKDCDCRRSWLIMIGASLLFIGLCAVGPLTVWHGLLLLTVLGWMLTDTWRESRNDPTAAADLEELEDVDPTMATWKVAALLAAGVVGLPLGAHLLIEGARGVAMAYGLTEAAVGLTLVAVGTSLPELMTSISAALRREADVAMGNVIGSNIFNILGIMGVSSLVAPISVAPEFLSLDLWVMLAASALIGVCLYPRWRLGRLAGLAFIALYVLFAVAVLGPRI
ncbi:calcium/sodium antiporter [Rubrimonas cliftonensis]|uniref:Cation:H+ antiporter n=1 Tax=Rubrimonas cliftonensis TaxID=89524 RepID=A0A1H3VIR1_9RHOB|nr:calcium/sodium antiporter [Rubrimonas cliftonensis]SDZ74134.1 cation:H+ antiporter [Rubrimonas cliftonensis]